MDMTVNMATESKTRRNFKLYNENTYEGLGLENLSFDVVSKPIVVEGFEIPDRKAIFRVGENHDPIYLATVSKNYPIIKHSDIISKLEDGFNFKNASVKTVLNKDGAQMQRIYTLNDYSVEVRPGDEISPSIRIVNSYDGSNAIGFYIDAIRLVCTNGMVAIKQFMSMNYKHFGNRFDLNFFAKNANKLIHGFEDYSGNWRKWITEKVDQERADLVLNYMPVRFRPLIESRYNNNFDGTKWGLYNAYTEAITHDFVGNKGMVSDSKKILLGSEVTKIFSDDWYWKSDKDDVINDLIKRKKINNIETENVEAEFSEIAV